MSWIERSNDKFILKTGDGKEFKPYWLNASKEVEYNVAQFEYPELAGSKVDRKTPKGTKYNLEIFFQGEDHLEQGLTFEQSAKDSRPWILSHPVYGAVTVQPISLGFDYTKYNVTRITGTIIETITEDNPKTTQVPLDVIVDYKQQTDDSFSSTFAADVIPDTNDINTLAANNTSLYNKGAKKVADTSEAETYFNAFNEANAAIVQATAKPLDAINKVQTVISAPAAFKIDVKTRIDLLQDQFTGLNDEVDTILTKSGKKIFENNAGMVIAAMASAASTPLPGNYGNRSQVLLIIEQIIVNYNLYVVSIDLLQSSNGGNTTSYIPDPVTLSLLNTLVKYTVSNLFNIALNAKQERVVYLEDDSNIILLAHRFYGLLPDDSTMDELMLNNNIGLNEILGIRKGRRIIYYV